MNEQIVAKCLILFLCNGEKFATLSKKKMPAKETKRARNTRTKSPSHIWSRRLERMCIPVVSVQSHHLIISTSYPLVFSYFLFSTILEVLIDCYSVSLHLQHQKLITCGWDETVKLDTSS